LAHRLVNFLPNRLSGIALSSHLTAPKFSPALIVLFNWLPSWLLPRVIVETGCLLCRLHPAASNLMMRQSALQSVYVLGWTCVSPIFADVARRSTLVVCTALSANRLGPGRSSRHDTLNDLVDRAFVAAGVPVPKEPVGLVRQDGKRPDGLAQIPFEGGRSLTWDVTVVCTLHHGWLLHWSCRAGSWLCGGDGSLSQGGEIHHFAESLWFSAIAVETMGSINESATSSLYDMGRRMSLVSGEDREPQFLF